MEITPSEILRTIYEGVLLGIYWLIEKGWQAVEWLPPDWPEWLRILIVLAGCVIGGRIALSLLYRVTNAPLSLLIIILKAWNRFWLLFKSPFGGAKWAGWNALRRDRMFQPGGLFLGQWRKWYFWRKDLYHHGEGHFLTIAAPGGGKSVAALIPSLLTCREGSFVVTDPQGELTAITRRHRASLGRVVYINPYYKDFEKGTGLEYPDSGFNPFDAIENDDNVAARCSNFARLLCVTDRKGSDSYFDDEGAELLTLFITWMVRHEPPENRTLTYLYTLVRQSPQEVFRYIDYIDDPLLTADAARFRDMFKDAKPQWSGAISKAQLATKRYVPTTPLALHTSKSGFDPAWLKSENITVYILIPSEHVQTAAPWLNLVVGLLGDAVGRAGKAQPVTFLLDELPALGYLPDLRTHMRQHRKAGLRMWLFSQTAAALSDPNMYGSEGAKDLYGLCDTKQFFSIRQYETASEISQMCGEKRLINRNLQASADDTGLSTVGVPLIRPEEVLRLRKGHQIIIRGDTPPIRARLVPYFKRWKWRRITDKNPYRN